MAKDKGKKDDNVRDLEAVRKDDKDIEENTPEIGDKTQNQGLLDAVEAEAKRLGLK